MPVLKSCCKGEEKKKTIGLGCAWWGQDKEKDISLWEVGTSAGLFKEIKQEERSREEASCDACSDIQMSWGDQV